MNLRLEVEQRLLVDLRVVSRSPPHITSATPSQREEVVLADDRRRA